MRTLLLFPLLVLAACAQTAPTTDGPETLDEARALWAAADLDTYSMTLTRTCFCPEDYRGPFQVTVEAGEVAEVRFQNRDLPTERAVSVDDLFDLLQTAYDEGAARVNATYHPTLGYPTSLYIDRSEQIADEEVGYTVENLE